MVANEATDRGRAARAIDRIERLDGRGRPDRRAARWPTRSPHAPAARRSSSSPTTPARRRPTLRTKAPVRVLTVGRERRQPGHRRARRARPMPAASKRRLFVSVANSRRERRHAAAPDPRRRPAGHRARPASRPADADRTWSSTSCPPGTSRRRGAAGRQSAARPERGRRRRSGPADQLPLDDAAWAIVPRDRLLRVLLVGPGNVYLQNALSLLPNVELYGADRRASRPTTTGKEQFDLIVFDGFLPADAAGQADPGHRAAAHERPGHGHGHARAAGHRPAAPPDEPLLRDVDLTRAARRDGAAHGAARLGAQRHPRTRPGAAALRRHARRAADGRVRLRPAPERPAAPGRLADPRLQPLGRAAGPRRQHARPGRARRAGRAGPAARQRGHARDAARRIGRASSSRRPARARQRDLRRNPPAGRLPAEPIPGRPRRAASGATASPTPSPSPVRGLRAAGRPPVPIRFAVDLFDLEESNIAPGDGARLTAHRRHAAPKVGTPGHGARRVVVRSRSWLSPCCSSSGSSTSATARVASVAGSVALGRRGPLRRRGAR